LGVEPQVGESIQQYCVRAATVLPRLQSSLDNVSVACEQALYNNGDWPSAQKAIANLKSE